MKRAEIVRYRRGITPALRAAVIDRDGGQCVYCGFPASEIDHVVPVARGGGLDLENLAHACWECNHEKLDLTVDEWAAGRKSSGKPWPVPTYDQRLAAVLQCGYCIEGYQPAEGWNGVTLEYEEFRKLIVRARDGLQVSEA